MKNHFSILMIYINRIIIPISQLKEPFDVDTFEYYFARKFYPLYKILDHYSNVKMLIHFMYIVANIQNLIINIEFDFITFIIERMHEKLVSSKIHPKKFKFKWHSFAIPYVFVFSKGSAR